MPDGSITFRESGFVSAATPSMLLARHNFETARIREELGSRHFARSLELGCGFGRLSPTFAEHSDAHLATDINEDALQAARLTYPTLTFQRISSGGLPFADNAFDLIATWTVLQHVRPEMVDITCSEIVRVLSDDGVLLMCEEIADRPTSVGHTWHRAIGAYEELLRPLRLIRQAPIAEIDKIPGMESPGVVMVFQR